MDRGIEVGRSWKLHFEKGGPTVLPKVAVFLLLLAFGTGCGDENNLPPVTMFARRVLQLRGSSSHLEYGESFKFASCSPTTCYGEVHGTKISVLKSDLQEFPPPKGPKYVVGEPAVPDGRTYHIDAFDPDKGVHLVEVDEWVSTGSLRDRPETKAEKEARIKAKQEEKEAKKRERALARQFSREATGRQTRSASYACSSWNEYEGLFLMEIGGQTTAFRNELTRAALSGECTTFHAGEEASVIETRTDPSDPLLGGKEPNSRESFL